MGAAEHQGEEYSLTITDQLMLSIDGLKWILAEKMRKYGKHPYALWMTEYQFLRLCTEASRSGRTFADAADGRRPSFLGIPISLLDDADDEEEDLED